MRETDALLQGILFNQKRAKTVEECIDIVEALCSKENLDAVEALLKKIEERNKNNKVAL